MRGLDWSAYPEGRGMAGAAAISPAVGADASARLRMLCLSAAVGISDECSRVLGVPELTSLGQAHMRRSVRAVDHAGDGGGGVVHDDDDDTTAAAGGSSTRATLDGCSEPLVHLLSRQASRIVELYESEPPASSISTARPILPVLSASPGLVAERAQQPDAVCSPPDADDQQHASNQERAQNGEERGGAPLRSTDDLVLKRLNDLMSIAYTRFYAYMYKDLPLCWRQLYTDAAILKFSFLFLSVPFCGRLKLGTPNVNVNHAAPLRPAGDPKQNDANKTDGHLIEMVRTLDLALILAGAGGHCRGRAWINQAFELLESSCTAAGGTWATAPVNTGHEHADEIAVAFTADVQPPAKRVKLVGDARPAASWEDRPSFSPHEPFTPPVRHSIRRVSADVMDMSAFQQYLDETLRDVGPEPLVLTGLVDHWPARADRPWDKPSYLLSRTFAGRRLVPVEVGRSYVDEGWGQRIVSFGEFLREYIDPSLSSAEPAEVNHLHQSKPTAYLAQHQLLLQLPQLRSDILIPDHCYTTPPRHPTDPSQDQPELEEPMLNAWFGPPGTITPLHTDPYHNLLVQVVGRKYVRVYALHQTERMRARGKEEGVEMGNTSLWDVGVIEGWDARPDDGDEDEGGEAVGLVQRAEEEDFRKVPFMDCILEPGDTLYIPIGWWHYVRGLSISFSVSIWWN